MTVGKLQLPALTTFSPTTPLFRPATHG